MKTNIAFALALWTVSISTSGILSAQVAAEPAAITVPQYGTPYNDLPDLEDVVIYQVNLRAFSREGNFAGLQARLDEIKALGANTLHILPIYPIGVLKTVHSPYCIRDYRAVDPEFGTLDELRTLVEEAHKRKLTVLLDWVANHTSWDNPWIANKSWYLQDTEGNIISPPGTGWNDVAALNYDNAEMRAAMIDAMRYWVFQANIDGYRCDAVDFQPVDFWAQAIKILRTVPSHKLLLFAEGKRNDNFTAGFDLQYGMNFYTNLAARIYGTHQSVSSLDILNKAEYREAVGHDQVVRYISNHDLAQTDGGALAVFDGKEGSLAAFVAAAYMKGVPMIYNGQEVGVATKISFFDRSTPIDWSANPSLLEEYKRIIGLRNASEALRKGELQSFGNDDVCAFTKTSGSEQVLVIVNLRRTPSALTLPETLRGTAWRNAYTGDDATVPESIELPPYEYRVYKKR